MPNTPSSDVLHRLSMVGMSLAALGQEQAAEAVSDGLATIERLSAELERKTEALQQCANKFWEYVIVHTDKHTPDGDKKAARNREMAEMCEAELAKGRAQ